MRLRLALICSLFLSVSLTWAFEQDFTRQIQVDTIGTLAFELHRTITGRAAASPDAILTARGSLIAQSGLCPGDFVIDHFSVDDDPPTLAYDARIRCK